MPLVELQQTGGLSHIARRSSSYVILEGNTWATMHKPHEEAKNECLNKERKEFIRTPFNPLSKQKALPNPEPLQNDHILVSFTTTVFTANDQSLYLIYRVFVDFFFWGGGGGGGDIFSNFCMYDKV